MYVCVCVSVCVCVYACMYACMHVCVCIYIEYRALEHPVPSLMAAYLSATLAHDVIRESPRHYINV